MIRDGKVRPSDDVRGFRSWVSFGEPPVKWVCDDDCVILTGAAASRGVIGTVATNAADVIQLWIPPSAKLSSNFTKNQYMCPHKAQQFYCLKWKHSSLTVLS